MARHELKTWPDYYEAVLRGDKTFEVRTDDRGGFAVGDTLVLREWDRVKEYSGRSCEVVVRYVLRDPKFGVAPGYAVIGITAPAEAVERRTHILVRVLDLSAVVALWAALLTQRTTPWQVSVMFQTLATVLVGASLFARGRTT